MAEDFPRLVLAACHDLRSPLSTAHGFARTLERIGELDERQRRYVELVVASTQDLDRLIGALGALARIEAGELRVAEEPYELAVVVRAAAEAASAALGEEREVDAAGGEGVRGLGDSAQLERGLSLLAEAAVRLSVEGGAASLEGRSDGAVLVRAPLDGARAALDNGTRDLRAAAARGLLSALGWTLAPGPEGVLAVPPARAT